MATIITHVILPSGTRFQQSWSDRDLYGNPRPLPSDATILKALDQGKLFFGYNGTVKKRDLSTNLPVLIDHADPASGFAYDNEKTAVAVVEIDGVIGQGEVTVREIRRLKGPPAEVPAPAPAPTPVQTPSPTEPLADIGKGI